MKWQRILSIYRFFVHKKGRPQAVKDVKNALEIEGVEVCLRDIQRDLADMRDMGVLDGIGAGQNLRYKIPDGQAMDFYGELNESDIFSFLLLSRILFWMFGESINIESLEKAISGSSKKALSLHGKDLYQNLAARMGGLLEYVGEQSAKNGRPEFLPIFIKGLLEQKRLEVEYNGIADNAPKKRVLEPWALVVYKSALYLLCHDPSLPKITLKSFKLTRFQRVKILNETFEKKHDTLKKELNRMKYNGTIWDAKREREETPVMVKLRFGWDCRLTLQEHLFLDNMKITEHKDEEWIEVRLKSPINKELLSWLRTWGYGVKVIAPMELKQEMANYGEWLCDYYINA
uniref:Helix-turn-helix type 11-like protein n=1 Tax=uncultured bacterium contig00111 TaxID=1181575 RepID=A0A806KLS3_9BACT|nr:helix-turn-helix type 11-like protein [uncultured bacterium contig00111]